MKKLLAIWLGLLLVGCSPTINYERSSEPGEIQVITMEDVHEKVENKETFMFVFTQESCLNCQEFKENISNDYISNHGFIFYEVVLSYDMETSPVFDWVEEHPNPIDQLEEGFTELDVLTPTFYFLKDGEVQDIYIGGAMNEKVLEEMIVKYQLDEVK